MAKKPTTRAPAVPGAPPVPVIVADDGSEILPDVQPDGTRSWPGYLRYTGAGQFVIGVPARDLSIEDWLELPPVLQAKAQGLALYTYQAGPLPAPVAETAGKEA